MKLAKGAAGGGKGLREVLQDLAASSPVPAQAQPLVLPCSHPTQMGLRPPSQQPHTMRCWSLLQRALGQGCRGTSLVLGLGLRSTTSFSHMHLHETRGSKGIGKQWGGQSSIKPLASTWQYPFKGTHYK